MPLVALAIAGCGGGDDGDSTASAPVETVEAPEALTKEKQVSLSAAICSEVNAGLAPVMYEGASGGDQVRQIAELRSSMGERLAEIEPPSDDTTGYAEFVEAAEQLAQAESNVVLAVDRGEEEALAAAEADASSALSSFQSVSAAWEAQPCTEEPNPPLESQTGESSGVEEESSAGVEEEVAPEEVEEEVAPEAGGAAPVEEESAGGGAAAGGGGSSESSGGGSSGGVGPG